MHPGMSLAERREAQHHAAINQQFPQIAATAHAGEWRGLPHRADQKSAQHRPAWLSDKPVLTLNATARLADVQRFFPTAIVADLPHRMPHLRVPAPDERMQQRTRLSRAIGKQR